MDKPTVEIVISSEDVDSFHKQVMGYLQHYIQGINLGATFFAQQLKQTIERSQQEMSAHGRSDKSEGMESKEKGKKAVPNAKRAKERNINRGQTASK